MQAVSLPLQMSVGVTDCTNNYHYMFDKNSVHFEVNDKLQTSAAAAPMYLPCAI